MSHEATCPRSQFWDAGDFEAHCTCDPMTQTKQLFTGTAGRRTFCLSEASRIATKAGDAATLVKCAEVYLDLAKLLGEKREQPKTGLPSRVVAGLKAEQDGPP